MQNLVSFLLALWFVSGLFAQPIPVGGASTGTITLRNNSAQGIALYGIAIDPDGLEIPGSMIGGTAALPAGATVVYTFVFPDGGTVNRFEFYRTAPQASIVGASFVYDSGAALTNLLIRTLNSSNSSPTAPFPNVTLTLTDYLPLSDGAKTVWQIDDATLTANLFREGIDKLVAASGSGSGSSSGSSSAVVEDLAQRQLDFIDSFDSGTADGSGGTSAAAAAVAVLPAQLGATTGYTLPTGGGAANLLIVFPESFGGATFDFNPFSAERMGGVTSWFRAATQWLAFILLGAWMWSQIGVWTRGLSTAQQAKGNPVAAGTGGQATALVAAGLLTVVILTAITALMAFTLDGITASSLRGIVGTNPLTDFLASSFWMLDQLLPVASLISCVVARLGFNLFANITFVTAMTVIRWIVP
jgi:hypothetical protein